MSQAALAAQKPQVPDAFNEVAGNYDLLTGMNPGYHAHLRLSAKRLELKAGERVLDLCCGTGASTRAILDTCAGVDLTGLDASAGMLEQARKKKALTGVDFVHGDAMDVEAAGVEGPFDAILMAYGIRNVPDPDLCLQRLQGLLRPGGRICFHEYSVADSLLAKFLWNAVCFGIIIPGGLFTSPRSGIYRYLRRSVNDFDGIEAFEARLRKHGFVDVNTQRMTGWQRGIVHSFLARRA